MLWCNVFSSFLPGPPELLLLYVMVTKQERCPYISGGIAPQLSLAAAERSSLGGCISTARIVPLSLPPCGGWHSGEIISICCNSEVGKNMIGDTTEHLNCSVLCCHCHFSSVAKCARQNEWAQPCCQESGFVLVQVGTTEALQMFLCSA